MTTIPAKPGPLPTAENPTGQHPTGQTTTVEETIARYPRLTAHLICESLGYFTPRAAAMAIRDHRIGRAHHCEWYSHMASGTRSVLQVGQNTILRAFQRRRCHQGYMADYPRALALVANEIQRTGPSPTFSSWQ